MTKKNVVGSGTGANYPVILGVVDALLEDGLEVESYTGVSGSAMCMSMLASGWTPHDALRLAKEIGPVDIIRPAWTMLTQPGVFQFDRMQDALESNVARTFNDTEVPLTIICTDSDTQEEVRYTSADTPDIRLPPAAQASTCIPWFARCVKMDGRRLTDGGVTHNFPVDIPKSDAVGIRVLGQKHDPKPWKWWGSFSVNIVDSMMRAAERAHVSRAVWQKAKIITVESPISGLDFHKLDDAMIDELYEIGKKAVHERFKNGWTWE